MRHLSNTILLWVLLLSGCRPGSMYPSASELFVEQSKATGIYVDGRQTLVYDPLVHQTAQRGNSFRLQTDDQSVYWSVLLEQIPTANAPITRGTIHTRGVSDVKDDTYSFQWIEERDGKMWLWCDEEKIGLIIPQKQ